MAEFLVEMYVSRTDPDAVEAGAERARRAAEDLSFEDHPIRYLRSLYVPEEETCFYLYEAASVEQVREAALGAGLPFERVLEAISDPRMNP